jgi:hypothetical protein
MDAGLLRVLGELTHVAEGDMWFSAGGDGED